MRRGNNMQSTGVQAGLAAAKAGCVLSAAGRMLAVAALLPAAMADEPCSPGWVDQFCWSGPDASVRAMAVFDAGDGPRLYVGGSFTHAACQPALRVASWDGERWSALPGGVDGTVLAMTVFDDGSGPGLYLGGSFRSIVHADGQTEAVERIVRFDGVQFVPLIDQGSGAAGVNNWVSALAVFDDGGGEALYAGGRMTMAGGRPVQHVARWDGQHWQAVGLDSETGGLNSWVTALAVFDDGNGPGLFAGGTFSLVGGQTPLSGIARWTGAHWEALMSNAGEGLDGTVLALAVHDDGSGPALFAGGAFPTQAQSLAVSNIARWDASGWSALSGPDGTGTSGTVHALASIDDAAGAALAVGGRFTAAGGVGVGNLARWHGDAWSAIGSGPGTDRTVDALAVFDEGAGGALFAGGAMTVADDVLVSHIVRVADGVISRIEAEGRPIAGALDGLVLAMRSVRDERGPAVYAVAESSFGARLLRMEDGGWREIPGDDLRYSYFPYSIASVPAGPVVGVWVAVEGRPRRIVDGQLVPDAALEAIIGSAQVLALEAHDDGVHGWGLHFIMRSSVPGFPSGTVARWDGVTLSAQIGPAGQSPTAASADEAYLKSLPLPGGRVLVAMAGPFAGPGVQGAALGFWDGTTWQPLTIPGQPASFQASDVRDMLVWEAAGGPLLVVSSRVALNVPSGPTFVAAWNGTQWLSLATPTWLTQSGRMDIFDDGLGEALSMSAMTSTDGISRIDLVRYRDQQWEPLTRPDGEDWEPFGTFFDPPFIAASVGAYRELLVYGEYSARVNNNLVTVPIEASYGGCPFVCIGDANGDGAVTPDDLAAFVQSLVAGEASADVNGDGRVDYFDVIRFMAAYEAGCP